MSSEAGAGSRKKIPGARAAPKQAGSETLAERLSRACFVRLPVGPTYSLIKKFRQSTLLVLVVYIFLAVF